MKAWQIEAFGMDGLKLNEVPTPEPGRGEILVKVSAVSLNYRDKAVLDCVYQPEKMPPGLIPVSDAAGVVVRTGPEVTRFSEGDRVTSHFYSRWIDGDPVPGGTDSSLGGPINGGLAEYLLLEESAAVATPASLTDEEAATLPIAALTPWFAMVEYGKLQQGQTVVVQGTGGLAVFAVQIASALGARVIATSSSDEKLARVKELGASELINYRATPDWPRRVLELTDGLGADQVLDRAGGDGLNDSIRATRAYGQISVIGFLSDPIAKVNLVPLILGHARICGMTVGHRKGFEKMNEFIVQSGIKPVIDAVYGFDEAHQAYEHLARGAFGKVVIRIH